MNSNFLPGDLVKISGWKASGMIIEYLGIKKIRTGLTRFNSHPVYLVQDFRTTQLKEFPAYMLSHL